MGKCTLTCLCLSVCLCIRVLLCCSRCVYVHKHASVCAQIHWTDGARGHLNKVAGVIRSSQRSENCRIVMEGCRAQWRKGNFINLYSRFVVNSALFCPGACLLTVRTLKLHIITQYDMSSRAASDELLCIYSAGLAIKASAFGHKTLFSQHLGQKQVFISQENWTAFI